MNEMIIKTAEGHRDNGDLVVGNHLGKNNSRVSGVLRESCSLVYIEKFPEFKSKMRQAVALTEKISIGIKSIINYSCNREPKAILYLEGDKHTFVPFIPDVAAPILNDMADLTLAKRSLKGRKQFPKLQNFAEDVVDRYIASKTGIKTDYTYGPRAFTVETAKFFNQYSRKDWGILTYPVVAALESGYTLASVEVPGEPQPGYMKKYGNAGFFKHCAWRFLQNIPHILAAKKAVLDCRRLKLKS